MEQNAIYPNQKRWHFYYILLIAFASFGFFKPTILEKTVVEHFRNFYFDVLLLLFLIALPTILKFTFQTPNYLFTLPLKLFALAIPLSMLMASVFWQQSISENIFSELTISCYLLYFFFMAKNIPVKIMERIITIIGFTYAFLYLVSFAINPVKFLEYKISTDREFLRIFLYGDGFLFLFYFFSLNKYSFNKSKIWLLGALMAFSCILLNQTRVYIAATALITVFYLFSSKKLSVRFLTLVVTIAAILIIPQLDYVQKLQKKTDKDLKKSDNYVRVKAAKYYIDDFQPSAVTRVLGNGFPVGETSLYSRTIFKLQAVQGYYTEDIGLIGLYAYMGILPVLAFLMIFYRGVKTKLTEGYVYLKMFIVFLISTCLTTDSTFSGSYVVAIAIVLYLYEHCRVEAQNTIIIVSENTTE